MYSIDVWCTPIHSHNARGNRKGSVNFIKKLTTTQRAGAIAITGGFRTTPTDSLDAHAALLPMELRVEKACSNAITRMATLTPEHPLHALLKKSSKGWVKRHRSPLHILASIFQIDPSKFEKIPPVRTHPKSRGSHDIHIDIPINKDTSKRVDANAVEQIKVYSDGSAHGGKVRAAAVLKRTGNPDRVLKFHLGTTEQHTVYEAELVGMILGLHLIKTEPRNKVKCALSVDNQAALSAIGSKMNKSGQHLAAAVLKLAKQLKKHGGNGRFRLTFRWSAGHVGIEGNEDADNAAKQAAEGSSSDNNDLPQYLRKTLGYSLSATRQSHNEKLKLQWIATWSKSPRYRRISYPDLLTPYSQKFLKYISSEGVSRTAASRVFQLRVGHAPLNLYLHRFKKVNSAQCPACGHPTETVEHYLVQCLKYAHERWPLLSKMRGNPPRLEKILSDTELLAPLINFIEATERFKAGPREDPVSNIC